MTRSSLRIIIVDDETLARKRLRSLLQRQEGLEVVAEASNGPEAVEAVLEHSPDLLFLDIQMPEMNGFEVLEALGNELESLPLVIFVTAFDEHAVRAFEVYALDYLVKPVERERFAATLERARETLSSRRRERLDQRMERIESLLHDHRRNEPRKTFVVRKGERMIVVRSEQIDWIEASGNYVTLHTAEGSFLLRETMQSIDGQLDSGRFARIHRSSIVNVSRIRELSPSFHGDFYVRLHDGTQLTLSRSHRARLEALLGKF
jgi:two-component system, LytTR family, response regulator